MNWSLFFGELVSGLTLGSIYALIALGYTMVYGILKLLNFAHGDVYMIGAFIGWYALHALGGPVSPSVSACSGCPVTSSTNEYQWCPVAYAGFSASARRYDRSAPSQSQS